MIKRKGQRIAAIAMAAAIMGQSIQPIFALEREEVSSQTEIVENIEASEEAVENSTKEENTQEDATTETENDSKEENNSEESNATIDFKVLAISDLHANLMNYDYYTGATTSDSGLVKTATLIKEQKKLANKSEKKEVDNVLLVDNGDTIQGTPLAHLYAVKNPVKEGQKYPVYEALESLGFDMTTIGNHEVNYGMDFINQIVKANSSMGTVCANVRYLIHIK